MKTNIHEKKENIIETKNSNGQIKIKAKMQSNMLRIAAYEW